MDGEGCFGLGGFDEDKVCNDRLQGGENCAKKGQEKAEWREVVIPIGTDNIKLRPNRWE